MTPATSKKPKCIKGTACGYSCISGKYSCSSRILARDAKTLVALAEPLARDGVNEVDTVQPYKVAKLLGEGGFGRAELTDRGTVVKTALEDMYVTPDMVTAEYNALKVMYEVGIGPKPLALSADKLQLEMSIVQGKQYESIELTDSDLMTAAVAILKLHKAGYTHNDLHMGNIIKTDAEGVKLIDGGTVRKAGDPDGYHGWFDMSPLIAKHPTFKDMSNAMAEHEQTYSDDIDRVSKANSPDMTFSDREKAKGAAKLKLHKAYLSLADNFIK